jgi:hypothetical protein
LTGVSQITENVQKFGGKTEGKLRFSIMWADGDGDNSDLDAHCKMSKNHIYFGNKQGILDVDIRTPQGKLAVENIVFTQVSDDTYKFMVHQYSTSGSKGFSAEIMMDGQMFTYTFNKPVPQSNYVDVATVTIKNGQFTIEHHLPETNASRSLWGLQSGEFHKCNLICHSPNHWGANEVGNLHYFFILDGCKSDIALRSYHPEYLNSELYESRKVLEYLSNTIMVEPAENQLAGVGFNSTISTEFILKLEGSHKRVIKVKV